jgi:hypothetical protein
MRKIFPAALAALLLAASPAMAADENYNTGSAATNNNDGNANCHSSTRLSGCGDSYTEAPLPLAGAGLAGLLLAGGAGGVAVLVRRRRERRPG